MAGFLKMFNVNLKFFENIYLIGGTVRDYLLNREINDYDFVCICKKDEFNEIAEKFFKLNFNKKPFLIGKESPPTYRAKFKNKIIDLTIIEKDFNYDAKRRDFTINSIYYDLENKKFIDPLNGIKDLKNKIIRVCSEKSIIIDPLRILRGIRFFSQLKDFKIEYLTFKKIIENKTLIKKIASERIKEEIDKIILSEKYFIAFKILKKYKIIDEFLDNIDWNNLDLVKKTPENLNDFEKRIFIYALLFNKCLKKLKPSNKELKIVKEIQNKYKILMNLNKKDDILNFIYFNRDYFYYIYKFSKTFFHLNNLKDIDNLYKEFLDKKDEIFTILNGNDLINLGLKSGPCFGKILDEVRIKFLKGDISTKKEALQYVKEKFFN